MRPLTLRRLLWTCGALTVVLVATVVVALKLGAVTISVTDLLTDLARVAIGRSGQLSSEYRLIIFDLRLPRILVGILVGAALGLGPEFALALSLMKRARELTLGVTGLVVWQSIEGNSLLRARSKARHSSKP